MDTPDKTEQRNKDTAWVISCIKSCDNAFQLFVCENIREQYRKKYPDATLEELWEIDNIFELVAIRTEYHQNKERIRKESLGIGR